MFFPSFDIDRIESKNVMKMDRQYQKDFEESIMI